MLDIKFSRGEENLYIPLHPVTWLASASIHTSPFHFAWWRCVLHFCKPHSPIRSPSLASAVAVPSVRSRLQAVSCGPGPGLCCLARLCLRGPWVPLFPFCEWPGCFSRSTATVSRAAAAKAFFGTAFFPFFFIGCVAVVGLHVQY